ncbi:hypothetical protein CA235_07450 [Sphingomonas sp. ABOLF]|uniref:hypothetical protein n=1 Tax=Sphingomonas sp. ABOLF TaxID=1985879 RepID=UPI000F7F2C85|nr:hypothetical protein [Sphingomonas sp. ABOLF]RSV15679.1 hypothetical protein CA235_07450 [Sphingomonas sp. ABOLF]
MLSDVFASAAVAVSGAFGGPYHAGKVHTVSETTYDAGGSILTPGQPVERDCMVQVDAVTEAMRQAEGFTERDVRLLVIGLAGDLDTDALVEVLPGATAPADHVGLWSIQSVSRDSLGVYRECRGRRG